MNTHEKLRGCFLGAVVFLGGCGGDAVPTTAVASAAPSASNALGDAGLPEVRPALVRKTTPGDKRIADEAACNGGNAEACRAMADRYRGYGHPGGCGVERKDHVRSLALANGSTLKLRIKRTSGDWAVDEESFTSWIGKACDLGHTEACSLDREPHENFGVKEKVAADMAVRSSLESSALLAWKKGKNPKAYEQLLAVRNKCTSESYKCANESIHLYRSDTKKPPTELEAATRELAETIITKTLDARAILMLLDRNGYTADMVAPVHAHAAKVLVDACVEGSCVCGDAAHFVPKDDARRLDLARFGCENGEAEGCYELARLYEEGVGVPKDERAARVLYELACPPYRPAEWSVGAKTSEYSVAACDRLAEIYEGGAMPPKDVARAQYYAEFACMDPGIQQDHAPCIRLGRYWTSRAIRSDCPSFEWCAGDLAQAMEKFNGPRQAPFEGKECERPSVKALCDKYKGELEEMARPK
jgi:TPR repeat protein